MDDAERSPVTHRLHGGVAEGSLVVVGDGHDDRCAMR
jgi:hypothetical protein